MKVKNSGFDPSLKNGVLFETITLNNKFSGLLAKLSDDRENVGNNGDYLLTTYSFMFYKHEDEWCLVIMFLYKFVYFVIVENNIIRLQYPGNNDKLIVIYNIPSSTVNDYNIMVITDTNINASSGQYQGYFTNRGPGDLYFGVLVGIKHRKDTDQSINNGILHEQSSSKQATLV